MAALELTAEDIAGWLTPRQALEILGTAFKPDLAKTELLERLMGGMVHAGATQTTIDGSRLKDGTLNQIPIDDWKRVSIYDNVWITGTLSVDYTERSYEPRRKLRFFDVRFHPDDIKAIVGPLLASQPLANDPSADDGTKGPPVAPDALKAWFELYQRVYTGAADTEATALKSAQGMFPGKSVSRDKIRALRGERPMGRPKREE
jgi:hypothetical protein